MIELSSKLMTELLLLQVWRLVENEKEWDVVTHAQRTLRIAESFRFVSLDAVFNMLYRINNLVAYQASYQEVVGSVGSYLALYKPNMSIWYYELNPKEVR